MEEDQDAVEGGRLRPASGGGRSSGSMNDESGSARHIILEVCNHQSGERLLQDPTDINIKGRTHKSDAGLDNDFAPETNASPEAPGVAMARTVAVDSR